MYTAGRKRNRPDGSFVLAPSVFAADYMNLQSQTDVLKSCGVTMLHVDVMDGHFVSNMAFGPDFVQALREKTAMSLDVHLMIEGPERKIDAFVQAGADTLTIHYEACENAETVLSVLDRIHACGIRAGVALRPQTALSQVPAEILRKADVLQLMTVQPGEKGQHFIPEMLDKIRDAKNRIAHLGRRIPIEVDGDINAGRIPEVVSAGAEIEESCAGKIFIESRERGKDRALCFACAE